MYKVPNLSKLPNEPAVYALYGGKSNRKFVAYVGIADKLRQRVTQHLVRKDSSITTGTSLVSLNPDMVTELRWWQNNSFSKRDYLEAAETIAFEILDPVLRSRGKLTERATQLLNDERFVIEMRELFSDEPTGSLDFPDVQDILSKISTLEQEITSLKALILKLEGKQNK